MTEEELNRITSHLYGIMDDLTDLTRHMNGIAGYMKIETVDAAQKLMDIEATMHKMVHRLTSAADEGN